MSTDTPAFDGLRMLEVADAGYLAGRMAGDLTAGVLAKSEWGIGDEPVVLCQKQACGTVVGYGVVKLSAPVPFANGWEAGDRVADNVGPVEITKATGDDAPVWYHTLYKSVVWAEPVVVKAAGKLSPGVGCTWVGERKSDDEDEDGEHTHDKDNPLGEHSHQDDDEGEAVYRQKALKGKEFEATSAVQHEIWASWMTHLFSLSAPGPDGTMIIPAKSVERWKRQIVTPYDKLTEKEKDGDRDQASKVADVLKAYLPRVITKAAVDEGWLPDEGSGLPESIEKSIPPALRYWENDSTEDRLMFRDLLVASELMAHGRIAKIDGELQLLGEIQGLDTPEGARVDFGAALESHATSGDRREANGTSNAQDDTDRILKRLAECTAASMSIVKAAPSKNDDEWGYVLSIALEANDGQDGNPLKPDAHKDIISEAELQRVGHEFARDFRGFGEMHQRKLGTDVIRFADSLVTQSDWVIKTKAGKLISDHAVWLLGAEVRRTSEFWKKIERGEINGWSIDGRGIKVPEIAKQS